MKSKWVDHRLHTTDFHGRLFFFLFFPENFPRSVEIMNECVDFDTFRHSAAHVLAAAVLRLFPDAKLDIGPSTRT
jgi:threonyl-tRNA synthetase